jgi:hypothetical protein
MRMKRILVSLAAASLTLLIGVALATLSTPLQQAPLAMAPDQSGVSPSQLDFAEVFRGFEFVGVGVLTDKRACPYGWLESHPLPEEFEAGRTYVFHYMDSAYAEPIFKTLEKRFRTFGMETSVSGRNYLGGGRPVPDTLLFKGKGYGGSVTREAHLIRPKGGKLSASWDVSHYALTLEKGP